MEWSASKLTSKLRSFSSASRGLLAWSVLCLESFLLANCFLPSSPASPPASEAQKIPRETNTMLRRVYKMSLRHSNFSASQSIPKAEFKKKHSGFDLCNAPKKNKKTLFFQEKFISCTSLHLHCLLIMGSQACSGT